MWRLRVYVPAFRLFFHTLSPSHYFLMSAIDGTAAPDPGYLLFWRRLPFRSLRRWGRLHCARRCQNLLQRVRGL